MPRRRERSKLQLAQTVFKIENYKKVWLRQGQGQRGSLREEKKRVPERQFCKKTACCSHVQPWLVAIGGWRLVPTVGGGWWLVIGGWWWLAVGGGWRLAAGGGWRLAAGGGWRLVIPWGGPSERSLTKKKSSSLRTPLVRVMVSVRVTQLVSLVRAYGPP